MPKLKNIDKNIKKLILKLNRNNLPTKFSCQGGLNGTHDPTAFILFNEVLKNQRLAKAIEIIEEFTPVDFEIKTKRIRKNPNKPDLKSVTAFNFVGTI